MDEATSAEDTNDTDTEDTEATSVDSTSLPEDTDQLHIPDAAPKTPDTDVTPKTTPQTPTGLTAFSPQVIQAQAMQESSLNPLAVGPQTRYGTAKGKFQIIDATWNRFAQAGENKWNPDDSLKVRNRYMQFLANKYPGNLNLQLAAYNTGEGNVDSAIKKAGGSTDYPDVAKFLSSETLNYVSGIHQKVNKQSPELAQFVNNSKLPGVIDKQGFAQQLMPLLSSPLYQTLSATDQVAAINKIYNSNIYNPEVKDVLKNLSTAIWSGASPDEVENLKQAIGRPDPNALLSVPDVGKAMDQWKASKLQTLEKQGITPELISAPFEDNFKAIKEDEVAAEQVRKRGLIGQFGTLVASNMANLVRGGVGIAADAAAFPARILADKLGAPDYSTTIEKLPSYIPYSNDRFSNYELDSTGHILLNSDGTPRTKWQTNFFRAYGNVLGALVGGTALRAVGAGATTVDTTLATTNALAQANNTFKTVYTQTQDKEKSYLSAFLSMPAAEAGTLLELSTLGDVGTKTLEGLSSFNKLKLIAKTAAFNTIPKGAAAFSLMDTGTQLAEKVSTGQDFDENRLLSSAVMGGVIGGLTGTPATFAERSVKLAQDHQIRTAVNSELQRFQYSHDPILNLKVDPQYVNKDVTDALGMTFDNASKGETTVTKNNFVPDEAANSQEALRNAVNVGFTPDEVKVMSQEKGALLHKASEEALTPQETARLSELSTKLKGTDSPDYFNKVKANERAYMDQVAKDTQEGKPVEQIPARWDPQIQAWINTQTGLDHPFLRAALGHDTEVLNAPSTDPASVTRPVQSFYPQSRANTQQFATEFTQPTPYVANNPEPMSTKEVTDAVKKLSRLSTAEPGSRGATIKVGGRMDSGTLGYYASGPAAIRLRSMADIPTAIHEVTHQVDRDLGNLVFKMATSDPKLADALYKQAITYYPDPKAVEGSPITALREGLTMFMQNKLTNQPVHNYLDNWWNTTFKQDHPQIYQQYQTIKDLADRYYSQTLDARTSAFKNPPKESIFKTWKEKLSDVNTWRALADKDYKFLELDQVLGRGGNFDAKAYHNWIDANDISSRQHANNLVNGEHMMDLQGNIVDGPTYLQIRKGLTADQNAALDNGLIAANAMVMIKRGQNPGIPVDDVRAMYANYKARPDIARLEQAQEAIYKWWEQTQNILASRSPRMQQVLAKVRAANREITATYDENGNKIAEGFDHGFYIPMKRVDGETSGGTGDLTTNAKAPNPVMRRRGSDKPIQNISTSFEQLAQSFSQAGLKNELYDRLIRDLRNNLPVGGMIQRIPPGMEKKYQNDLETILDQTVSTVKKDTGLTATKKSPVTTEAETAKTASNNIDAATQQFISSLSKETGTSADDILKSTIQFWHPETSLHPQTAAKGYMVLAIPKPAGNGSEFYEVHPNLLKAFNGVEMPEILRHPVFDLLFRTPKRLLQVGATTANPAFQMRNFFVKDWQTGILTQEPGVSAVNFFRHLLGEVTDQIVTGVTGRTASPAAWATRMGLNSATRAGAAKELEYVAQGNGLASKIWNTAHKSLSALEFVSGLGENATRLAAMRAKADSMGLNLFDPKTKINQLQAIELALAYKNSTINFGKRGEGAGTTFLRESVPFYGARVAGLEQSIDAAINNPKRALAIAAGSFALGVYAYTQNKGKPWYDDLSDNTKATAFVVDADKKMLAFPLDDYLSVFHSLGVATAKQFAEATPNETTTLDLMREALQKTAPFDIPLDKSGALSFAALPGGTIFKELTQQLVNEDFFRGTPIVQEKKATTEQYTNKTSELMKEIGRVTNMSPDRIEHFVSTFAAGPLKVEKFFEKQTGVKPVNEDEGTNLLLRAFMREASNAAIQDKSSKAFYDAVAQSSQNKYQETDEQGLARKRIGSLAKHITDLNKQIAEEKDPEARDALYTKRREMYREGAALWANPSRVNEEVQ